MNELSKKYFLMSYFDVFLHNIFSQLCVNSESITRDTLKNLQKLDKINISFPILMETQEKNNHLMKLSFSQSVMRIEQQIVDVFLMAHFILGQKC